MLLPPLLLQPLVENAIRHGIANLPEGGVIGLNVQRTPASVSIIVENSFDPDTPSKLKTGLGTRQRTTAVARALRRRRERNVRRKRESLFSEAAFAGAAEW